MTFPSDFSNIKPGSNSKKPIATPGGYDPNDFIEYELGKGVHSEEYKTALQLAEEFDQIVDYEERIRFWSKYLLVFGQAVVIVFDEKEQTYWPYYGRPLDKLHEDLGDETERYKAFWVLPSDMDEFWLFVDWCMDWRQDNKYLTIMEEEYYWKRIGQHLEPKIFIKKLLKAAKDLRKDTETLPNHWGIEQLTTADAKRYFFFYGDQDATQGDLGGISGSTFNLYNTLQKMVLYPVPDYGDIFFHYYDGYHTAMMVTFLRQQKERLRNGEDIRLPIPEQSYKPIEEKVTGTEAFDVDSNSDFSVREKILIHCYELGEPLKKGEKHYNDYITFASPTKRKSYPNESLPKTKWLIKTIEKILPSLSINAAKQAESELNTLKANI